MTVPVSVCMIAKNEATRIGESIRSISPYVQEVIVVDTGSEDETARIAESLGACVFFHPWNDDFSAARNAALAHATQPFILMLDADEQFVADSEGALAAYCRRQGPEAGKVRIRNFTQADGAGVTIAEITRLFPNLPEYRYSGIIHEQLLYAGETPTAVSTDIWIDHTGYTAEAICANNKVERNLRLLHAENDKTPNHPYTLYQMARTYFLDKRYQEAQRYFQEGIDAVTEQSQQPPPWFPTLLGQYAYALLYQRDFPLLFHVLEAAIDLYPDFTDLYFAYGLALIELKDANRLAEIRETFEYCLHLGDPDPQKYETVQGVGSYIARYNLGVYYEVIGDLAEAVRWYEAAAASGYEQAKHRLTLLSRHDKPSLHEN